MPVNPPAAYLGGKRQLSRRICTLISSTPHSTYAEPFVGMGGVFFRRDKAPKAEVINDRSGDVANLFRILQRHYPQFMDTLRFQVTSRREFERLNASDPLTLTDLERAARFLYLQRTAFGGKVAGRTFGVSPGRSAAFNLNRLASTLADVHERLAGVVIECLDWQAFVTRYDRPDTLFYLDPPYFGSESDYGRGMFERSEFDVMAATLASIKGKFILSINNTVEMCKTFQRFSIDKVDLTYSVSNAGSTKAHELIIHGP